MHTILIVILRIVKLLIFAANFKVVKLLLCSEPVAYTLIKKHIFTLTGQCTACSAVQVGYWGLV